LIIVVHLFLKILNRVVFLSIDRGDEIEAHPFIVGRAHASGAMTQ
jgi:hypothetical protein